MSELLSRIGRNPDEHLVIITCHGFGSSNAANHGVHRALRQGIATSAGLQVPSPWSRAAAAGHQGDDVGVNLTFVSEHDLYRWGPITRAPSLLDGDGGFPRTIDDLGEHADIDEVRREARAQIERAILWGFDPTYLGTHLDCLCFRPELFDTCLDLAIEFRLPMSLPDPSVDVGFPARALTAEAGVIVPDVVVEAPADKPSRTVVDRALQELKPGVTEIRLRPAIDTPELRAISNRWAAQVGDDHLATDDWTFRAALERSKAELIGFEELREAQRSG